jgi:hypothetical protein
MTNLAFLYLMGQPAGGASGQSNALITFLPLLLVFVVFYFFMITTDEKTEEMTNYEAQRRQGYNYRWYIQQDLW